MLAMLMHAWGEPEELRLSEVPDPEPGPGEVAIDVRAIGCNFADLLMVRGKYQVRPPFPFAPGAEVAGVVRAVGAGVEDFACGDRVFAVLSWGGFASVAVAPQSSVVRLVGDMSFADAAGFGVVYQTAYLGLVRQAGLRAGETLLVHAAAGGVGLAAVQVGRALDARVLATAGSSEKLEVACRHGAEAGFLSSDPDWGQRVKEATGGRGADVVFDPVGGDVFDQSTRCLAFGGRLLVVGFASGRTPEIRVNRIMLKNISVVGIHLGGYREHDPELVRGANTALCDLYEKGLLRPLISRTYPLQDAAAALQEIASRRSVGKVLLLPPRG
jgi:NADPH2:quinone reductase